MKKLVFIVITLFVAMFSVGGNASASTSHRLCAFKVINGQTHYKTLSYNTFATNAQGYKYAYDGECDNRTLCTSVYDPVCGKSGNNYKTFSNRCELGKTSYRFQYTGTCRTRADIQVTSVSVQNASHISRGSSVTLKTTLRVSGLASGVSIDLRSYLSNQYGGRLETCSGANPRTSRNTLSSGSETITHTCRFDYFRSTTPNGDRYTFESVADVSDRVRESNEHNNSKTTSVRIGSTSNSCNNSGYAPVCGKRGSSEKTFNNSCELYAQSSYSYAYSGRCGDRNNNTAHSCSNAAYAPVCGKDGSRERTFDNSCELYSQSSYSYAYSGKCGDRNNTYNDYYNNSSRSCSSQTTRYICGRDGNSFRTFKNTCYLDRDSRYDYAYSGRCTTSRNNSYRDNGYYNNYNSYNNRYQSNTYRYSNNNPYDTHNATSSDNINYSYNDGLRYNTNTNYYNSSNNYSYNRYGNNYSPNYSSYFTSSNNRQSCQTYSMRQLVPACHYKYSTNQYGCTRPIIHCEGYVRDKFVNNNSYSFTSYGVTRDSNKCPVFKLSASVNGCSYEYIKNEDGCDIPKLVCGTANTTLSGNLKVKADRELAEKYAQIDNTYLNKNSKIIALKNVKTKLEAELRKNSTDTALLKYMIASIEEKIEEYEKSDGVTPIFDILY